MDREVLGIVVTIFSSAVLVLVMLSLIWLLFKNKSKDRYLFSGLLIVAVVLVMFIASVRIISRPGYYMLPDRVFPPEEIFPLNERLREGDEGWDEFYKEWKKHNSPWTVNVDNWDNWYPQWKEANPQFFKDEELSE